MSWSFKKRAGYTYKDSIKVRDTRDEYRIIADTPCDNCREGRYEKNQGADPHSRYAEGGFFDVIHCECQRCEHKRDFVFDVNEFPDFKKIIETANSAGPGALESFGNQYNEMVQPVVGTCPRCGTPFRMRPGQVFTGVPCGKCGAILQVDE